MRSRRSYVKRYSVVTGIVWLSMACILQFSCGGTPDENAVSKKTMENLYYAYEENADADAAPDTSLTSTLGIYSLDPEIFGDPVRIIPEFEDSLTLHPATRQNALVVTDPTADMPTGILMEEISGGKVLTYTCRNSMGEVDECWSRIGIFAKDRGYECKPPGIELFRDFGVESRSDTSTVELLIRIK
jgi:hypothetical protein